MPPRKELLTHLKLQKLAFYCYGAALAFDHAEDVGSDIVFEAWEHGPVNREIWKEYRDYKGNPIPPLDHVESPRYAPATEAVLSDSITIYGVMDAWSLRQESHREAPWKEGSTTAEKRIATESLRLHFVKKYRGHSVAYPEFLAHLSSFLLDGIPVQGQPSLHDLALAVAAAAAS